MSGVRPVVGGGGMVANRRPERSGLLFLKLLRRGGELLLCWIGVSPVDVCFSVLVVTMDGSLTDLASVGRR